MASPRQWWRRATATAKDRWSIYVTRMGGARHRHHHHHHLHRRSPEVEAAVIRATSHDDRSVDYKSAGRVFTWARGAPSSLLPPLMWSVASRASRTRSWIVALKCLLLAHGLLLCSDDAPPSAHVGRLPFDLSDFRGRSSTSPGFSAFVRAYYRFVDRRSFFSALTGSPSSSPSQAASGAGDQDDDLEQLERLQVLLDLLMQIRPYADGMEVSLVLEAMDCVVIEIFEVYSSICSGIAHFLVGILGPDQYGAMTEARRRRGRVGMRILKRAAAQNSQLSSYFDLCRTLRVLNAADLPPVEGIPEKDMDDLERLVLGGTTGSDEEAAAGNGGGRAEREVQGKKSDGHFGTVITNEWVVFEDEGHCGTEGRGDFGHSTCRSPDNIWPSTSWAQREWQSHPSDLPSSILI